MSLHDITYSADGLHYKDLRQRLGSAPLQGFLTEAHTVVERLRLSDTSPLPQPETSSDFEHLRWFPYPCEINAAEAGP